MASTMTKGQQARKVVNKDVKQAAEFTPQVSEEVKDPLNELMNQAQAAYGSYLQAQRKVATAYQHAQYEGEKAYKETEAQAANLCAETMEKALQAREKAEREAEEQYKETRGRAGQAYQDSATEALRVRKETVEKAWEATKGNSDKIWTIFQSGTET